MPHKKFFQKKQREREEQINNNKQHIRMVKRMVGKLLPNEVSRFGMRSKMFPTLSFFFFFFWQFKWSTVRSSCFYGIYLFVNSKIHYSDSVAARRGEADFHQKKKRIRFDSTREEQESTEWGGWVTILRRDWLGKRRHDGLTACVGF